MPGELTPTQELRVIVRRLKEIKLSDLEKEDLWNRFDMLANEFDTGSYKVVDTDSKWKAARVHVVPSPKVDFTILESNLTHDQWVAISNQVRSGDMKKLETAVHDDIVSKEAVESAMVTPAPYDRHIVDVATAKEMKEAEA